MENILKEPLENYLTQKRQPFAGNILADKLRNEYPELLTSLISDETRYKVVGSSGQGNWATCPWIAILDILVTNSAQAGYYPVFLYKADMTGVYLSLNQGVTEIRDYYKSETRNVLRLRAEDFRAKLDIRPEHLTTISLNSNTLYAKLYEAGNIVAKYYDVKDLPSEEKLRSDIFDFLHLYEELTFNDQQIDEKKELTAIEKKQYRLHFRIERNTSIAKKVKAIKGYKCEACQFDFISKYGELGDKFIEAHHLRPISSLNVGKFKVNIESDFAVLCSNCHSMIHRLEDSSNIEQLRALLRD
jgi:Predicted restriction endonuclease